MRVQRKLAVLYKQFNTINDHLAEVSARIEELNALKVTLLEMSSTCDDDGDDGKIKDCGVLKKN